MTSVYDFHAKDIDGKDVSLKDFKGKTLLIVNTASRCGFTKQYAGLEALQKNHKDKLEVLGFPCNQFGAQEPGTEKEIKEFCQLTYDTTFRLFSKVDVNGNEAHPLFVYLKNELPGIMGSTGIKWNFTKFLVDKGGKPVKRFAPDETPESIEGFIKDYL